MTGYINKFDRYKITMSLMIKDIQLLKNYNMVNIIHLNTLLGIIIIVLLDHYIYLFHKLLTILINLIKIK